MMTKRTLLTIVVCVLALSTAPAQVPQLKEWMSYYPFGDPIPLQNFDTQHGCRTAIVNGMGFGNDNVLFLRNSTDTASSYQWTTGIVRATGDFNGDGVKDYFTCRGNFLFGQENGVPPIQSDTIAGPVQSPKNSFGNILFSKVFVLDLNRDGKDDIVLVNVYGDGNVFEPKHDTCGVVVFGATKVEDMLVYKLKNNHNSHSQTIYGMYKNAQGEFRYCSRIGWLSGYQSWMELGSVIIDDGAEEVRMQPISKRDVYRNGTPLQYYTLANMLYYNAQTGSAYLLSSGDTKQGTYCFDLSGDRIDAMVNHLVKCTGGGWVSNGLNGFVSYNGAILQGYAESSTEYNALVFDGEPRYWNKPNGYIPNKYNVTDKDTARLGETAFGSTAMALGDVNNDGTMDFATIYNSNPYTLKIFLGNSNVTSVESNEVEATIDSPSPHPLQQGKSFTIKIEAKEATHLHAVLIDMHGTTVAELFSAHVESGIQTINSVTPQVVPGVYILRTHTANTVKHQCVVVQ